ncbi:hypothetical protein WA1_23895 [Scytonema hofmannii PCC 7110]|uniref:Uncharacterized protein n=1 Tax=Scytonema hofmannii PCC 7110 TaxID=128403 RepID=A0A139X7K8_9CYAN|nr:hypothetical protein [Scytonema hofmannii]KYC40687.1 hypothetical protein WA1_23895 [Scytonema hofmannii PCC 7110]
MFASDRTNTNRLDGSHTSFVNNGTQASIISSNSDRGVLSTENLFTGTFSSSVTSLPDLIVENASNTERAIARCI